MNSKKFYPVIHCVTLKEDGINHALQNARIARTNGADGVFLIGHKVRSGELCHIYENVRKHHPNIWIGINFLDIAKSGNTIDLFSAVRKCSGLNGLWFDRLPDARLDLPRTIEVFGGVAFKYIEPNIAGQALLIACERAVRTVDVATTSGSATGSAPEVLKLETISKLLGGRIPLAVASGVSADNVTEMLPHTDIFLVASSLIEKDPDYGGHEYLVPEHVRVCADKIHTYQA